MLFDLSIFHQKMMNIIIHISPIHGIQCLHFFLMVSSSLVLRDDGKTVGGETEITLPFFTLICRMMGKKKQ